MIRELQAAAREMGALDVTEAVVNVTFDFTLLFSLSQQIDPVHQDGEATEQDAAVVNTKPIGMLTVLPDQALEETLARLCTEYSVSDSVCLELYLGLHNQVVGLWGCQDERSATESDANGVTDLQPIAVPSSSLVEETPEQRGEDERHAIHIPVFVSQLDGGTQQLLFTMHSTQDLDLAVALFCRKHTVNLDGCGLLLTQARNATHLSPAFQHGRRSVQKPETSSTKRFRIASPDSTRLYPVSQRVHIEVDLANHSSAALGAGDDSESAASKSQLDEICIYVNYDPTPAMCREVPFPDVVYFSAHQLPLGHHIVLFAPRHAGRGSAVLEDATDPQSINLRIDDSKWIGAAHIEVVNPSVTLLTVVSETHPVSGRAYLTAVIQTTHFDVMDTLYRVCILHNDDFECMNPSMLLIENGESGRDANRTVTFRAPIYNASTGAHEITIMLVNEYGNAIALTKTVAIDVDVKANTALLPRDPAYVVDLRGFVAKRPSTCPERLASDQDGALSWICKLWMHEWGQFSQNGEDGVLRSIFYNIGTTTKQYVEFGTEDGSQCNTRYWRENHDWTGLLMDGKYANEKINLQREFVTAENINALFTKYSVPKQLDLLSIDVDFNDYWILDAIDLAKFAPRVIVIEYNAHIPPSEARSVKYNPEGVWDGRTDFFGTSMAALHRWGVRHNYSLVYCESHGVNCFLVRNDAMRGVNVSAFLPAEEVFVPPNFFGKGWSYPNASRPEDEWVWV